MQINNFDVYITCIYINCIIDVFITSKKHFIFRPFIENSYGNHNILEVTYMIVPTLTKIYGCYNRNLFISMAPTIIIIC